MHLSDTVDGESAAAAADMSCWRVNIGDQYSPEAGVVESWLIRATEGYAAKALWEQSKKPDQFFVLSVEPAKCAEHLPTTQE